MKDPLATPTTCLTGMVNKDEFFGGNVPGHARYGTPHQTDSRGPEPVRKVFGCEPRIHQ